MTALALAPREGAAAFRTSTAAPPKLDQIAERMRKVRGMRGYTVSAAAELIGVAKQTVSQWERSECQPTLKHLLRFCRVMHIDARDLLGGLSADLEPLPRQRSTTQLLPLYDLQAAGEMLMGAVVDLSEPLRRVPVLRTHPAGSIAFAVRGKTMLPRFIDGDVVTIAPASAAEPGQLVLAHIKGREQPIVFRRYLPRIEGRSAGALLRTLDGVTPDIEMAEGDAVIGIMREHISTSHGL